MQPLTPIHVLIQNYQSIASASFEIRGFTVLVGKTNTGKSAITRAISSCLLNLPVVGAVRKGTNHVMVNIKNGENEILWEKGEKKINRYTINGHLYDKVERKQLSEIAAMGFGSIEIGDTKIQPWYASQFEPIFLLNKTGPQVTDFISEVSRLQVIQNAMVLSARGKRTEADQIKGIDTDIIDTETQIEKFEDLDKLDSLWVDIQAMRDSIIEYEDRLSRMSSIHAGIRGSRERISLIQNVTDASIPDIDLSLQLETLQKRRSSFSTLQSLTRSILTLRRVSEIPELEAPTAEWEHLSKLRSFSSLPSLAKSVAQLRDVSKINIPQEDMTQDCQKLASMRMFSEQIRKHADGIRKYRNPVPDLPDTESSREELDRISNMRGVLASLLENRKQIDLLESELKQVNRSYSDVLEELETFSSCPLCGQELKHEHSSEKTAGEV